jgi:ATP-binding cassette subfamily B (MDR/TAP) protein 1
VAFIKEIDRQFSLKRLLAYNNPEWYFIVLGCISSIVSGAIMPAFAIVLSEVVTVKTYSLISKFQ